MTAFRATLDPQPTWYRLPDDAWAMIRAEYLDGATAKVLAERWKVSPTSIYRHACAEGWTKKRRGAAVFEAERARAEGEAQAAASAEARAGADADPDPDEAMDPAEAARAAMLEAGRAVKAGRYGDAERLTRLADSLSKLAQSPAFIDAEVEANDETMRLGLMSAVTRVATHMLQDKLVDTNICSRIVLRWRAETFGEEVAEADRARMKPGSAVYAQFYDETGAIRDGLCVIEDLARARAADAAADEAETQQPAFIAALKMDDDQSA